MPVSWSWRMRQTASSQMGPSNHQWPEELGVEGRTEHRRDGSVETGRERLVYEGDEVAGVLAGTLGGLVRPVDVLVADVDPGPVTCQ